MLTFNASHHYLFSGPLLWLLECTLYLSFCPMWSVFSLEPRVTSLPCGQAVGSEASYTENGIHILHQWGPRWFPPVLITPMIKLVLYKYQLDEPNHFLYFNYVLSYVLQKTKDAKLLETRSLSVVIRLKSQLDIHPKCHWYIWIKVIGGILIEKQALNAQMHTSSGRAFIFLVGSWEKQKGGSLVMILWERNTFWLMIYFS